MKLLWVLVIMLHFWHILTTPQSYHHKILLSMYSSTYIYLYGSQNTAVSTATRQWAGQPRIKVQSLAGARSLVQSIQIGSWLWTCPASYAVGIRTLSPGENMSEHEADRSPPPPPPLTVELYHNPRHAFMACRHSFTPFWHHTCVPELESGNRAATYTQVSSFQSAKYNLQTSSRKMPQTHNTFLFSV